MSNVNFHLYDYYRKIKLTRICIISYAEKKITFFFKKLNHLIHAGDRNNIPLCLGPGCHGLSFALGVCCKSAQSLTEDAYIRVCVLSVVQFPWCLLAQRFLQPRGSVAEQGIQTKETRKGRREEKNKKLGTPH